MKNFLYHALLLCLFSCGISFSAQAQCDTPEAIPYSIDFEDCFASINSFPPCWTEVESSGYYPYPVLMDNMEQCLAFSGYCIAALPEMSVPLNGLRISFDVRVQNLNNRIIISVIDWPDLSEMETMVDIDTITLPMTGVFYHQEVHLDSYTGEGRYILIQHEGTGSAVTYIDNVLVDEMPDCLNPINVQATGITDQSATLSWTEAGSATQWRVVRSLNPITDFSTVSPSTVNTPSIAYNNLMANMTYYFYVQSVCGSDYSAWSSTIFTTACGTASLPLQEGFSYGAMPDCWSFQQVSGSSTVTFVASGQNPFVSPASGEAMVQWSSGSYQAGRQGRLVSPIVASNGGAVCVNFKWYHGSENPEAVNEGVQIQYSADGTTWVNAYQGLIPRYHALLSGWTEYDVVLPAVNTPSLCIGFLFTSGGGRNCYLDEVNVHEAFGCFTPANLAVSDVAGNSATVTWTAVGSANNWQLVVSDVPLANPSSAAPINVTSTTYNLQNLNPLTPYYLYVRSACSTNNYSEWSHGVTFTTGCGTVMNLPYSENFDDYGTGSNAFPECWSRPATSYYQSSVTPSASNISSVNGDNSLIFCTGSNMQTYAITPAIGAELHDLSLSFYLFVEDANLSGSLEVGVMSNPNDYATFEHVETFNSDAAGVWTFHPVSFENTTLTGSGRYIVFRHNGVSDFNYCLIDELTILPHTDCWPAQHLALSGVTGNEATLAWDNVNESDVTWHLKMAEYPLADPMDYANVLDTLLHGESFHINYLNGGTTYYYYLQSDCGSSDVSVWQSGSFTTDPCNCYVNIIMHDQYGDGWNGAKIQMKRGNTVIAEVTLEDGSLDTAMIYTCEAGNIDYYFVGSPVQSSYDAEISFEIENSYGMQIYASSGTPVAGSFTHNSPSCGVDCSGVPANVNAVAISGGRATVCWNAVSAAQSYTVYRNGEVVAEYIPNTCCTVPTVEGENCFTVAGVCIVGESSPSAPSCVVGVQEYEAPVAVRIFPNPANDKVVVESVTPFTRVEICNLLGQTIHADSFNASVSRTELALPYSAGIYLVKVWCGNQCSVSKLVIQK